MNAADVLLPKLDKVRKTGPNTWRAICPAHPSKHGSLTLSVRDGDDGRVLVHCHAGCSVDEILGAVGLTIDDLFPARLPYNHSPMRRPWPAADVLDAVAQETLIVAVAACNVAKGITLLPVDHERLLVASERILEARRLANGER